MAGTGINRRTFLRSSALGAASFGIPTIIGCGGKSGGGDDEMKLDIGIIALTDCSPIVIAQEKGFFKKHGVEATITKQANWKAVQDNLAAGAIQATHMLIGMPIASTMGLLGSDKVPMIAPWILNRNGQAISLKAELKGKVGADAKHTKKWFTDLVKDGKPPSMPAFGDKVKGKDLDNLVAYLASLKGEAKK